MKWTISRFRGYVSAARSAYSTTVSGMTVFHSSFPPSSRQPSTTAWNRGSYRAVYPRWRIGLAVT